MNRSDDRPNYDDTLGQMLRWSLRSDTRRRGPSQAVWPLIQARARDWDLRPRKRELAGRACRRALDTGEAAGAMLRRGGGMVLAAAEGFGGLCALVWRFVDERTVSSEAVWLADTHNAPRNLLALRYRLTVQVISAGPLLGQRLPII
jgi:hypothetical protein